jgi:pimeloyl-ACP methyl ester carboxylesterase
MIRRVEGTVSANNMNIHYLDMGDVQAEPVLMVMGLACQMTAWPESLLNQLLSAGYRVIVYDNRDIGLSTEVGARLKSAPPLAFLKFRLGLPVDAPYTLYDMAADADGLLSALGIDAAHLVGVSMGGMITQILGACYPARVRSATIIMSSDNHRRNPAPDLRVLWRLNGGGIKGHDLASVTARGLAFWQVVQSPDYPADPDQVRARIAQNYHRSYRPAGILRQMRAIMATGDLRSLHDKITQPVQIIHGEADPLVKLPCAQQLADRISHSDLHVIRGMGHDLPDQLMPRFAQLIDANIRRARPRRR